MRQWRGCGSQRKPTTRCARRSSSPPATGEPVKGERLAEAQGIPLQFLEHILLELKHARLIQARRGAKGGYWLARDPSEITIADVIRAVEGPLANIHENAPEELHYGGPAERLRDVWVAVRAALRSVLESVTLAEISGGDLPVAHRGDPQRPRGLAQALSSAARLSRAFWDQVGPQRS